MNVRPTSTPNTSASDASALRRPPSAADERSGAAAGAAGERRPDVVELSPEALELFTSRAAASPAQISPERLKTILARMAEGFYERPDVRDRVLGRLVADLESSN